MTSTLSCDATNFLEIAIASRTGFGRSNRSDPARLAWRMPVVILMRSRTNAPLNLMRAIDEPVF
jgi:hypothetical protein